MTDQKEEVVISGIGGVFPESNNIEELKALLFNKLNGITIDSRRWDLNELGDTNGIGKIKNVDDIDEIFFNMHPKLAESTDPLTKNYMERSIEAIIDAGLSPADLNGTNTGVFICTTISENEALFLTDMKEAKHGMIGKARTMPANRLSCLLNMSGPSFAMNGSWMCSSMALENAKKMIEDGIITSAIVGTCNLCLRPELQYQYQGLGRLNRGNCTKPFSVYADGYNRSDACISMFLQRSSDAKRSYGTLLSVKSVQCGNSCGHITDHDGNHLKSLLLESYKNNNIDPGSVEYIEAYGSGIKAEDDIELSVMEKVFCNKARKKPLKVGSVKSNVGHSETSGLFTSIVKALIALDSGYIPPNINYIENNDSHAAIKNGKIQIVTEKTPLVSDIIGISSFGFVNAFSHVILKRNNKIKCSIHDSKSNDLIPKLILASGRNEENTRETINMITKHGNDSEFLALTHEVFTTNINTHCYRSFSIFPSSKESPIHDVWNVTFKKRPVWFIFSGTGSQWQGMGSDLMRLPIFADSIDKCDSILKPRGVDIKYILTSLDQELFDNILNSFVGIAAIQIGLVDVLKELEIVPDGVIGHSAGELGCAYADGCFTAEEMLLSAYARGRTYLETDMIPGMMAAIGIGYNQIKNRLPQDIDVACRNNASNCTISGPKDSVNKFVSLLMSEGIFAKTVNAAGIALHSRYIQAAGPTLLRYLKEVISDPKPRSSKWISTSLPESEWESDLAKYSSAEYHTNNLLNSVLFEDSLKHIPNDAVVIEIAPHGLLQAIIKKALPDTVTNIPVTKKTYGNSIEFLLNAIGKMYSCGMNPKVQEIYPKIKFPVSRKTPSLSTLPLWDHTKQWSQRLEINSVVNKKSAEKYNSLDLNDKIYLNGYELYSQPIIPPSFILLSVWKMFVQMNMKQIYSGPVKFQSLWFKNNIKILPNRSSENDVYLMIQRGSGLFEYNFNNELVCSGKISFLDERDIHTESIQHKQLEEISNTFDGSVFKDEIYDILKSNGYYLKENYKNIIKIDTSDKFIHGFVKWTNDWVYFIDGLLRFTLLDGLENHDINVPVSIREIEIYPTMYQNVPEKDVFVIYDKITKEINCPGIKISDVKNDSLLLRKVKTTDVKLEERIFVNFNHSTWTNIDDFINDAISIISEVDELNLGTFNEKIIVYTPYHCDNSISKACTKSLKRILDSQLSFKILKLTWDNIKKTSEYNESGGFIMVTSFQYLQDAIKILTNKKYCYIFVSSEQKLQDFKNWKIIVQHKFNNISHLALIKKAIKLDENTLYVKQPKDDYDFSIWRTLDKHNTSTGLIHIVSKTEPIEGIQNYVKNMLTKYRTRWLRFLFILDSNAPDLDSNKSFYKNELVKGLMINIYKNGGWGFHKRIPVQDLNDSMHMISEYPLLINIAIQSKSSHTIKYLGLNYKDLVVDDNTKNEFGPFDYTCVVENGKAAMGIATYEQTSHKIKYESLLSWPVPSTWSLEDATTVPLTYAMIYYVFNILHSLRCGQSILITSPTHPIGQAAITIGLSKKCEIYTVVETSQDAERLSNMFPKLTRSRILVNTNNNFDISVLMMTKSKGVNIVLNFLSGKSFHAALQTISYHGKFFHFSKYDMKPNVKVGSRMFLRNTSLTVISSRMLLNESEQNKRVVHLSFMDGLIKGIIKPFSRYDLKTFSNNRSIFDTMKIAFTINPLQKIVLSINDVLAYLKSLAKSQFSTYQIHPEQINVIVANNLEWLDLAEWLVERGAGKIVIVVKRCFMSQTKCKSDKICKRFNRLISQNLSLQVEPDMYLETDDKALNWLNRLTSSNVLGSMFIVNQLHDQTINNLRYAFVENKNKTKMTPFVCMLSDGELTCARMMSKGLKAFNISWDENSTQPKHVSRILPLLDTLLLNTNTERSSSIICSEKNKNKEEWSQEINHVIENYFPHSVLDLHNLNEIIRIDPGFVEVQTKSPRFSQWKSVVPVFVITGFRPKIFEMLYKQFFYPVFEARIPEHFDSIDELSRTLIEEIKHITNNGCVSLIGESWGGIVALKMAQLLESQGILVTVALLNGDPATVTSWAEYFLSSDYCANKLDIMYMTNPDEVLNYSPQTDDDLNTSRESMYKKSLKENTTRNVNWIRSCLRMSLLAKPLPNKLYTKVLIFKYSKIAELNKINDLTDYCVNPPCVYFVPGSNYKQMMTDKEMIKVLTNMVVYPYVALGNEMSLCEKYKNFYFKLEKLIKE